MGSASDVPRFCVLQVSIAALVTLSLPSLQDVETTDTWPDITESFSSAQPAYLRLSLQSGFHLRCDVIVAPCASTAPALTSHSLAGIKAWMHDVFLSGHGRSRMGSTSDVPRFCVLQTELASDIRSIKNFQKSIDGKVSVINTRLDELEAKTRSVEELRQSTCSIQSSLQVVDARLDSVDSRLDEIEDRSRRCNLLLRGIPDARETWQQSEALVKQRLGTVLRCLPEGNTLTVLE
ncbi:hypothetical protein HPB50_009271 [Hyalomma asiaticum]|uniref:Uncharacterized protein n=1 Tax=Hyalomma asiaticum TaxID=266040 RepID=A0ACB7RTA2_HYAAI|nr:hypothetical protein HPB50_009271 [Hyalomma asiaticum]